jgi:hypothetical protein
MWCAGTPPGLYGSKPSAPKKELLVEHYLVNRMGQKPRYQVQNTSGKQKPKHTRPDKNKWIPKFGRSNAF